MLQKDLESEAGMKSICDALWNRGRSLDQDEGGNKSDKSWQWYKFELQATEGDSDTRRTTRNEARNRKNAYTKSEDTLRMVT